MTVLIYFSTAFGVTALLTAMILRIGAMMSHCPERGPAAWVASITVATGFATIGLGASLLVGGLIPMLNWADSAMAAVFAAGFVTLCLGLGFSQAVATLRTVFEPELPEQAITT